MPNDSTKRNHPPADHWRSVLDAPYQQHGTAFGIVYRVYCETSNVSYVSQTADVSRSRRQKTDRPGRVSAHYTALQKGCHPCPVLQAAWNATNGESFRDELLEVVPMQSVRDREHLITRATHWQEQFSVEAEEAAKDWHYALKTKELRMLKDSGILNNATLVYFILKLKNPWCDRPLKIKPLELAIEWDIPESSIYEAIGKLKEAEVIDIDQAEITIRWTEYSQQADPFWESRINSEKSEPVLESQNGV